MNCSYRDLVLDLPCLNDEAWNGRCSEHGGVHPSVTKLMTLLGKLTGWSDQSLSVTMGYKRARVQTAQDESHLDNNTWGFTAGTRICGQDRDVHAQGRTLEEALWALCNEVVNKLEDINRRQSEYASKGRTSLNEFLQPIHVS